MAAVQQCITPTNSEPTDTESASPRKPGRAFLESMEEESRRSTEFLRHRRRLRYGAGSFTSAGGEAGAPRRMRVNTLPRSFTTSYSSAVVDPEVDDNDLDNPVHRSPRVLSGGGGRGGGRSRRGPLNSTGSMQDVLQTDGDINLHSVVFNGKGDVDDSSFTPVSPRQSSPRGQSAPPGTDSYTGITPRPHSASSGSESFSSSRGSPVTRSPSHSGRSSLSPPPPVAPKPRRSSLGSRGSGGRSVSPSGTQIVTTTVKIQARNKKTEPNDHSSPNQFHGSFPSVDVAGRPAEHRYHGSGPRSQ